MELAGLEITGERRYLKRLKELEAELDRWWEKRRRWLALAFNSTIPEELLITRVELWRGDSLEQIHIKPMA